MDLLGALNVLARVVKTDSFSAVARERALGQAIRKMSQLEEHFGARLFRRTTRKLSLNDDGQMLLDSAWPILDGVKGMEAAAERLARRDIAILRTRRAHLPRRCNAFQLQQHIAQTKKHCLRRSRICASPIGSF
jgi:DNA-binding transcriptional LysR family regulator